MTKVWVATLFAVCLSLGTASAAPVLVGGLSGVVGTGRPGSTVAIGEGATVRLTTTGGFVQRSDGDLDLVPEGPSATRVLPAASPTGGPAAINFVLDEGSDLTLIFRQSASIVWGRFTGEVVLAALNPLSSATLRILDLTLLGTFTPVRPALITQFGGPDPVDASLVLSFSQLRTGGTISGNFSLSIPPIDVPAPASLLVLGFASLALGLVARRRGRADRDVGKSYTRG